MCPHNGGVQQQVFQVRVSGAVFKECFPDTILRPAGKAFVNGVSVLVSIRQQTPLSTGTSNPENSFEKLAAAFLGADVNAGAGSQKGKNAAPLIIS